MDLSNGLYEQSFDLSTLFDQFIKEKRFLANLSERTLAMYRESLARYTKFIGSIPISKLTLNDFVVKMREHGLSVITTNITIRNMNSFLSCSSLD